MSELNMAYSSDDLRSGAAGHEETAAAADRVATALGLAVLPGAALGRVPSAAGLLASLEAARTERGRAAAAEAAARIALAEQVRLSATLADLGTAETTGIASSASPWYRPGSIAEGMGG